jgi:hypothetical protein
MSGKGKGKRSGRLPAGARRVGNRIMYEDMDGGLHTKQHQALNYNQRVESDRSRGLSGGCGQDADRLKKK